MKYFHALTAVFFLSINIATLTGQISFSNQTGLLTNPDNYFSGIAVAVSDMNGDGLDDIVRLDLGKQLTVEYQTPGGQPFSHFDFGSISNEEAWSIAVGDVNNDGYCDILTGGWYDGVKVITATNNGANYQSATLPGPNIFIQGSNLADINNDGHLDVFACHDDGESRIWGNNGDGTFSMADQWIDMATVPPSDNSGNYGSIWTDFDNDGDNDLYIAKCRQGINNPEDPKRINALFVNDGQSNYAEAAGEYGLKIKWQSWTADFQDIDNDGDMDCLVTNHDYNLQLLENDGTGHFTDISEQAGIDFDGGFLQGIMRDFDNDGFVDIITAEPTYLFHNNGDKTFTQISNPFGGADLGTLAAGDLNHDGRIDLYSAFACGINTPCGVPDKLWMNTTANGNHFLAVNLHGVASNRMGVGARIEIHGSWGVQIREVRSGESYGIMNSLTQHFGLGQETEIEYVVVRWPSGIVDVVKNPAADQFLTIEENNSCSLGNFELEVIGPDTICAGEIVTLTAPAGYDYLWSNGATGQSLTVDAQGNFKVLLVDSAGCVSVSNLVKIAVYPDETPSLETTGETTFCLGGSVTLSSSGAAAYSWSNGETSQSITVTQGGDYFVTVPGICGDFSSEVIHVEMLPAPAPTADDVTIYQPGPATLIATGNDPRWYDSPTAIEPLAANDTFITPDLTEDATFYVEDLYKYGGGNFATGMINHQGSPYSGDETNAQLFFDVFQPFTLKKVKVYTDLPGQRIIELRNAANTILQLLPVDIPVGTSVIDLNFYIEPGNGYRLTTNEQNNQQQFGFKSPRLRRSNQGVLYPYEVPDVVSIFNSNQGPGYYYYFYDWQIELEPVKCVSERIPVTVTLEPNATTEILPFDKIAVQPNPSSGLFLLSVLAAENGEAVLTVTDVNGRKFLNEKMKVRKETSVERSVDLSEAAPGIYFLQIKSGERIGRLKLVVK